MKQLKQLSFVVLLLSACTNKQTSPDSSYQPFPAGYGYMQDTAALQQAVENNNIAVIREHAWNLWAGIMQPATGTDWPVWYTWPNTTAAFSETGDKMLGANKSIEAIKRLLKLSATNVIKDSLPLPIYNIPQPVINEFAKDGIFTQDSTNIKPGRHFLFNGDIMIPTESLSQEAFDWIRNNNLYKQSQLIADSSMHSLNAPPQYIVTKHMFWPVLANSLSAIPVWTNPYPPDYDQYAGYETWDRLIAVDATGKLVGTKQKVSYLHGVLDANGKPLDSITREAQVYGLQDFYYHQVTQKDWDSFDASDKAAIKCSSYWAYNKSFGPGDYLVTIAMHVNTKEVPGWALQSVWWAEKPDTGMYAANQPNIPQAKGPWKHYNMVDAYGNIDPATGKLPIGMNPYIELVIHPVATNCNNCHIRAGFPASPQAGTASYQNPDCPDLLEKLTPQSPCLSKYLRTDFQWIIPDRAIADQGKK